MEIIGGQGVLQELPGGAAWHAAGVQNRPNAGVPLSAHQGTTALRDSAVNDPLFDLGFERAKDGYRWNHIPAGLRAPAEDGWLGTP